MVIETGVHEAYRGAKVQTMLGLGVCKLKGSYDRFCQADCVTLSTNPLYNNVIPICIAA